MREVGTREEKREGEYLCSMPYMVIVGSDPISPALMVSL